MDFHLLSHNLLAPAFLAFTVGLLARLLRSDLAFPEQLSQALGIYLLFAIGIKGGATLSGVSWGAIAWPALATLGLGSAIPLLAYPIARRWLRLSRIDAAALAAHYGSTSAVTFLAAAAYITHLGDTYEGVMPGLLALMEVPGIAVALWLARRAAGDGDEDRPALLPALAKVMTGKSIVLLIGGMGVGWIADPAALAKIDAFFVHPFVGILCLFLLDLGTVAAERLRGLDARWWRVALFAIAMPLINGGIGILVGTWTGLSVGGTTLFAVLAASASYIAAPAAVRSTLPHADLGLCLAAAIGITFPFNLSLGIPLYYAMAQALVGR
ncbi:MAG: sodium-dependent bicarbonate transport family permease [Planctomycetota bacterium]|nr:sodium-dependent bicarbonate transport family permease [Planctomycetota bacterium]MCX8039318.1 sodium-dependent bicarbonate transport family permease [Planctomycetota bacterium]MDW8372083.1 sodium-dependent bicarbonate transport family permease [Planctomycetota bacterium]